MAKNTLTSEQNAEFDGFMRKWQGLLGLNDWRVERSPKLSKAMAEVTIDYSARLASYRTGDFAGEPITPASLEATALHECLHVLLADITKPDNPPAELAESLEHRVVNVLEKLLMKGSHD